MKKGEENQVRNEGHQNVEFAYSSSDKSKQTWLSRQVTTETKSENQVTKHTNLTINKHDKKKRPDFTNKSQDLPIYNLKKNIDKRG